MIWVVTYDKATCWPPHGCMRTQQGCLWPKNGCICTQKWLFVTQDSFLWTRHDYPCKFNTSACGPGWQPVDTTWRSVTRDVCLWAQLGSLWPNCLLVDLIWLLVTEDVCLWTRHGDLWTQHGCLWPCKPSFGQNRLTCVDTTWLLVTWYVCLWTQQDYMWSKMSTCVDTTWWFVTKYCVDLKWLLLDTRMPVS
jgi:hypothetical protein